MKNAKVLKVLGGLGVASATATTLGLGIAKIEEHKETIGVLNKQLKDAEVFVKTQEKKHTIALTSAQNKLETVEKEKKFSWSTMQGLREELEVLKKAPSGLPQRVKEESKDAFIKALASTNIELKSNLDKALLSNSNLQTKYSKLLIEHEKLKKQLISQTQEPDITDVTEPELA